MATDSPSVVEELQHVYRYVHDVPGLHDLQGMDRVADLHGGLLLHEFEENFFLSAKFRGGAITDCELFLMTLKGKLYHESFFRHITPGVHESSPPGPIGAWGRLSSPCSVPFREVP